jgi:transcription initiation factor TFIIIB Brf1 subunit/transcription initiation factor TFIIB
LFDNNFDPYQALINIDKNIQAVIAAHNALAKKVEEQGHTIDILIEGLNNSNRANEHLMREMLTNINEKTKEMR